MMHYILSYLFSSAIAQFGIAGILLAFSIFVWIEAKLPITRHFATAVATGSAVFLFIGVWLYNEGVQHEKAQWQAAEDFARMEAEQARKDAEQSVAKDNAGAGSKRTAKRLRNDRYDRNHD